MRIKIKFIPSFNTVPCFQSEQKAMIQTAASQVNLQPDNSGWGPQEQTASKSARDCQRVSFSLADYKKTLPHNLEYQ